MIDLNALAGKQFIVIGRAGMDLYPEPVGCSIEAAQSYRSALGGSSANICVALQRQGCSTALLTCVSDDAIGRYCLAQLDHYGIDKQYVRSVAGEFRNSLALSECRLEGHQTVIYRNGAADFQMTVEDIKAVPLSQYNALITTGTVLAAEPSRTAAMYAFEQAAKLGIPLIFDVDYRPYSWASAEEAAEVYSKAAGLGDIIIGNDTEFGFMAGNYDRGLDKARELAQGTASVVIYKMGERGSITLTKDPQAKNTGTGLVERKTGIFPVEAMKPVGAGDSFMGGFIASLANAYSLDDAVVRGSACAAMVVTRVGCAPAMPTEAELDAFLRDHQ